MSSSDKPASNNFCVFSVIHALSGKSAEFIPASLSCSASSSATTSVSDTVLPASWFDVVVVLSMLTSVPLISNSPCIASTESFTDAPPISRILSFTWSSCPCKTSSASASRLPRANNSSMALLDCMISLADSAVRSSMLVALIPSSFVISISPDASLINVFVISGGNNSPI